MTSEGPKSTLIGSHGRQTPPLVGSTNSGCLKARRRLSELPLKRSVGQRNRRTELGRRFSCCRFITQKTGAEPRTTTTPLSRCASLCRRTPDRYCGQRHCAGAWPDIPHFLWLLLSGMKVMGLHPRLVPERWMWVSFMLTAVTSAKPAEILRPSLGCREHACCDEHTGNQQGVCKGTDAKDSDRANRHSEDNAPHPCQQLHNHVPRVRVGYVGKRVVPTVHHKLVNPIHRRHPQKKAWSAVSNLILSVKQGEVSHN